MKSNSLLVLAVGLMLIVASWLLPSVAGGRRAWTDELAQQYQQASISYHNAQHQAAHDASAGSNHPHEHESAQAEDAKLQQARDDYNRLKGQLEAAQTKGQNSSLVLWWLGVGVSLTGCALFIAQRQSPR